MSDRRFPRESYPHPIRQYSGMGVRPPIWHPGLPLPPPLPESGIPLPRPVPMPVQNALHMAGRMPTPGPHYHQLHQPFPHSAPNNPMYGLDTIQRCMDHTLAPWTSVYPRSSDNARLRDPVHQPAEEAYAVRRRGEERTSAVASESSVIVQGVPTAVESSRTASRHARRSALDESSKGVGRSTSVIVNNRSSSPRSTNCSAATSTPTSKPPSSQHGSNLRTAVSSSASNDLRSASACSSGACPITEAASGSMQDSPTTATSSELVSSTVVTSPPAIATSPLIAPPTTPGPTTSALPTTVACNSTLPSSSLLAPPSTVASDVVAPPTVAAQPTVASPASTRTSVKDPTTDTASAVKLPIATELATLHRAPVATPSVETPPTMTSPSSSLATAGVAQLPHNGHLCGDVAAQGACKQPCEPAQPDKKPTIVDGRVLGCSQPTPDHSVNPSAVLVKREVPHWSECNEGQDSGPSGKCATLPSTISTRKRPASLLDCENTSTSICSSLFKQEPDEMSSSCKRFVISPADDSNPVPSTDGRESSRVSPHPSGSAASDDSDVTIDLDPYDEDDHCCNHDNLDVVPAESIVPGDLRVCNKCRNLLLKNGDQLQRVELNPDTSQSRILYRTPVMSLHGDPPQEYLIKPDMHVLLQSRSSYLAAHPGPFQLPSSEIVTLVHPPPHGIQNSTVTCFKIESEESEMRRNSVAAVSNYKNGRHVRPSKASSRAKKESRRSVIMLDSTDEASASRDSDSASSSGSFTEGTNSTHRSSQDSPASSLCLDPESIESISLLNLTDYSPPDRRRWSMEDVTELGAGLDRQSLELLQDFSPEDVVQWKKLKVKRSTGETPLHQACSKGLMSMAKYFLQVEHMSPDVQDNAGWTPLHEACSHRHHKVASLLLDHGASPSVCAHDGTMPIHDAVEANDLAGVKLLIKYGAGIAPESGERLPLEIAKSKGFLAIAEYLQELMDKTSRAEVKSSEGHSSSQLDRTCSADAKLAGQSYRLDEFSLGPELDFPLFFLTPFFDECERQMPVAFNLTVPGEFSGRRHNFYLMDNLVKAFGLSEAAVHRALKEDNLRTYRMKPDLVRKQIKQSKIYVIPRALCNLHRDVELVPDCSVLHDLLGIRRVDIEQ